MKTLNYLFLLLLIGCVGEDIEYPDPIISIPNQTSELILNNTLQLEYVLTVGDTVVPESFIWNSQDTLIAKINSDGLVSGVGIGETQIVATALYKDLEVSRQFNLTVTGFEPMIILRNPLKTLANGESIQYSYQYIDESGNETTPQNLTWSSANIAVASITNAGLLTAHSMGETVIHAAITSNNITDTLATDTLTIGTITEFETIRLFISNSISNINVGATHQLDYMFFRGGEEVDQSELTTTWTSTNPDVIMVDNMGLLTAVSSGNTSISLSVENSSNESASQTIEIEAIALSQTRTGRMISTSYGLGGSFELVDENEEYLTLKFNSDYTFGSAPGPYLWLTNTTGTPNTASDYKIGALTIFSGAHEYQIPKTEVSLFEYETVLFYCEPFSTPLGYGLFD